MTKMLFVLMCVTLLVGQSCSQVFTEKEQASIIEKNNDLRRQQAFETGARNMAERKWSTFLANKAQKQAEMCTLIYDQGKNHDFNFGFMGTLGKFNSNQDFWYSAKRLYDFKKNQCSNKFSCAAYINIVLNVGAYMGCGRHKCAKVVDEKGKVIKSNSYFLVCAFNKSATYENGKFKRPFSRNARSCLKCASSMFNDQSALCKMK